MWPIFMWPKYHAAGYQQKFTIGLICTLVYKAYLTVVMLQLIVM